MNKGKSSGEMLHDDYPNTRGCGLLAIIVIVMLVILIVIL